MPIGTDELWQCQRCLGDTFYVGGSKEGRYCAFCGYRKEVKDESKIIGAIADRGVSAGGDRRIP